MRGCRSQALRSGDWAVATRRRTPVPHCHYGNSLRQGRLWATSCGLRGLRCKSPSRQVDRPSRAASARARPETGEKRSAGLRLTPGVLYTLPCLWAELALPARGIASAGRYRCGPLGSGWRRGPHVARELSPGPSIGHWHALSPTVQQLFHVKQFPQARSTPAPWPERGQLEFAGLGVPLRVLAGRRPQRGGGGAQARGHDARQH